MPLSQGEADNVDRMGLAEYIFKHLGCDRSLVPEYLRCEEGPADNSDAAGG